jgi:hypothetical protein
MIDMRIPGQMTEGELRGIERLATAVPDGGCVVETGSLYGRSSFVWAKSVRPSVSVYCIDPWVREPWIIELVEKTIPDCPPFGIDAFRRYTQDCRNINMIQGYSPDDVKRWTRPVDLYFDDSLHHNPYFRRNLRFWLGHVKPGGIMCGHDYCAEWPDVIAEVDALARELGVPVHRRQWLWWIELPAPLPTRTTRWARQWRHARQH